jgi:ABC-type amino acid transport substrate-binding protein
MPVPSAAPAGQEYVVGVEDLDYQPYFGLGPDGGYRGFARELFDAFAAARGVRLRYLPLPVNRLYASFFAGRLDLKFPDNPLWQGELRQGHQVTYSQPVVGLLDGVMVPAGARGRGLAALKTLGIVSGFTPAEGLQPEIRAGRVRVVENANFPALLDQVLAGRVDGAYANVAVSRYLFAQMKQPRAGQASGLEFDPALPHYAGHYFLATIRHPEVVAAFDLWMKEAAPWVAGLKKRHGVDVVEGHPGGATPGGR